MKKSVEATVQQYVDAWNNEGIETFKAAFSQCLSQSVKYTDPHFEVEGIDAIAQLANESLQQFPTRIFKLVTQPEHHHQVARYTWGITLVDKPFEGQDVLEFDENGLITRIISFF